MIKKTILVIFALFTMAMSDTPAVLRVVGGGYPSFTVSGYTGKYLTGAGFIIRDKESNVWLVTCVHTIKGTKETGRATRIWLQRNVTEWVTYEDEVGRGEITEWTTASDYTTEGHIADIAVALAPINDWTWNAVTHKVFDLTKNHGTEVGDEVIVWTGRGQGQEVNPAEPREIILGRRVNRAEQEPNTIWITFPNYRDMKGSSGSVVTAREDHERIAGMLCGEDDKGPEAYGRLQGPTAIEETINAAKQKKDWKREGNGVEHATP